MAFADWINPFNKVVDVASEFITDKDKLNEFDFKLKEMGIDVYIRELSTKTVSWVDALHKMGRQIQGYLAMAITGYLVYKGIDISVQEAALLGGPAAIYQVMKGKGK